MREVYDVAPFSRHFEGGKEGETAPPLLVVRVCDSIACELAGAEELLKKLSFGKDVKVTHAPCVGRCEVAPCVVVGQNPIGNATVASVKAAVNGKRVHCETTKYIDFAA